jgi:phosphopantothenoylcysteine synthetase/decarboxylase
VQVIATPAALGFIDPQTIETQTGLPVRSVYRQPDQPRRSAPPPDAVIVAPATFNTINKLAAGISDNYALGVLAESIGRAVPTVILPFINTALAARAPLTSATDALRREGVHVLLGDGGFEPHPPGTGGTRTATFPWAKALAALPGEGSSPK